MTLKREIKAGDIVIIRANVAEVGSTWLQVRQPGGLQFSAPKDSVIDIQEPPLVVGDTVFYENYIYRTETGTLLLIHGDDAVVECTGIKHLTVIKYKDLRRTRECAV